MPTATNEPLELLERLVRLESPSGRPDLVLRVLEVLRGEFEAVGARGRVSRDDTCLVADIDVTGAERVLFVGHADTVWPVGTLDGDLPWRLDGLTVRGPGVFDMKAGLVVMVHALARARPRGLRYAVRIVIVGDEEVGSPHGRAHIARAAEACTTAIGFESPHPDGALKVGRFGVSRVEVKVTGVAAHAALDPDAGVSATDELVDQLLRIRGIVDRAPSSSLGAVLRNLGRLHSDALANVVAEQATAQIGLRFPVAAQEAAVLDALTALEPIRPGAGIAVSVPGRRPAWTARDGDRQLAAQLWPDGPASRPAAGAADTNALGLLPLAVVDGFGPRGGGAHALHEHVELGDIEARIALLTEWLTS